MLGIIGAMDGEVAGLKEKMSQATVRKIAGMEFCEGILDRSCHAVVVKSGIGKVNAAVCAQILCSEYGVDGIINTGIAGSLNPAIDIGDIVLSREAVHHDVDAQVFGYAPGQIPQMSVFSFPGDERLMELAEASCKRANLQIHMMRGRVLSGDQFISSAAKKQQLTELFHGDCAEMEGAAVAQTAWLNGVPCLIVRSISDKADDSAQMDYDVFEKKAIENSVAIILEMTKSLESYGF